MFLYVFFGSQYICLASVTIIEALLLNNNSSSYTRWPVYDGWFIPHGQFALGTVCLMDGLSNNQS